MFNIQVDFIDILTNYNVFYKPFPYYNEWYRMFVETTFLTASLEGSLEVFHLMRNILFLGNQFIDPPLLYAYINSFVRQYPRNLFLGQMIDQLIKLCYLHKCVVVLINAT